MSADKQPTDKFGALGAVLAKDLSAIEDLPNFIAPPAGSYKLLITSASQKVINDKQAFVVEYIFVEPITLNDAQADQQELDEMKVQWGKDKMSEAFWFNDADRIETTLGVLKKKYGGLGATLGTTNLMEILDKMPNMTVAAQVGRKVDENDKSKYHPYTRSIVAQA